MPITVKLWGLDSHGKVFSQNAKTLDIASNGARLFGVTAALERGYIVGLQWGNMRARFMVCLGWREGQSTRRPDRLAGRRKRHLERCLATRLRR